MVQVDNFKAEIINYIFKYILNNDIVTKQACTIKNSVLCSQCIVNVNWTYSREHILLIRPAQNHKNRNVSAVVKNSALE